MHTPARYAEIFNCSTKHYMYVTFGFNTKKSWGNFLHSLPEEDPEKDIKEAEILHDIIVLNSKCTSKWRLQINMPTVWHIWTV